jgi:arsenite-transporting ATPase
VRLVLCSGKGGVGKTTLAAALALRFAVRHPQRRVLVVSTDPAHSLGDCLAMPLGPEPRTVHAAENLWGLEIDPQALLAEHLKVDGAALRAILARGTPLDDDDLGSVLALPFPGLDEVMALTHIMKLIQEERFDLIILDTAPTGHTLRLLNLPAVMQAWVAYLDTLMDKHRYLSRAYSGRYRPDSSDALIEKLNENLRAITALLRDRNRCRLMVITQAEPMIQAETGRLLKSLQKIGIDVGALIINGVTPNGGDCPVCAWQASAQRAIVDQLSQAWPSLRLVLLPAIPSEIRNQRQLLALLDQAQTYGEWRHENTTPVKVAAKPAAAKIGAPPPALELFIFCGKGGVGKTSLASAYALRLSEQRRGSRTLLVSTDPAHSLADCFRQPIGDRETPLAGHEGLYALEIDSRQRYAQLKADYANDIDRLLAEEDEVSGVELRFDREVLTGLLELTPPGLDEIIALTELARHVEAHSYDQYVIDTAPTGHALRFLELPSLVMSWLRTLLNVTLKYPGFAGKSGAMDLLIGLIRKVKTVKRLLTDPLRCRCFPVAAPGQLIRVETQRLVEALKRLNIPLGGMFLNRLIQSGDGCRYCTRRVSEQRRQTAAFRDAFPGLALIPVPYLPGLETPGELLEFAP